MELRVLKYFLTVAREESITKAADRLRNSKTKSAYDILMECK